MKKNPPTLNSAAEGKIIYILGIVILVQFVYPITQNNNITLVLLYQFMYASLIFAGVLISREKPILNRALIFLGGMWVVSAVILTANPGSIGPILLAYAAIILFQVTVTGILIQYIFTARVVSVDVIYAACAVYLLLGAIFVPIYGTIESITYAQTNGLHAFSASTITEGTLFPWQDFIYYSYVTLTTLGYGDILPVTMAARSAVTLEAIIGVLYITIVMARLVGLYTSHEVVEEEEEEHEREREHEREHEQDHSTFDHIDRES